MSIITEKIKYFVKEKNISQNELARLANYSPGSFANLVNGKKPFPEKVVKKLLPILEVSKEEFESWILADKYSKEVIELAIQAKKDKTPRGKSIFTTRIDEILKGKGLSRTAFSKLIQHSQSGLNRVIIRKEPLSETVLEKLAKGLERSEEEILAWHVVDDYSLRVLELALTNSQ